MELSQANISDKKTCWVEGKYVYKERNTYTLTWNMIRELQEQVVVLVVVVVVKQLCALTFSPKNFPLYIEKKRWKRIEYNKNVVDKTSRYNSMEGTCVQVL